QTTTLNRISSLFLEPTVFVQYPQIQHMKGHPVGAKNKSSTQRDLSSFKLIETERLTNKCSLCQKTGHNSRTCEQNNREKYMNS
ncbi:11229_t:CDS:1, partial [Racocetra persica]